MQKWVQALNTGEEQDSIPEQQGSTPERSRDGSNWINIVLSIWVIVSPVVLASHSSKAIWSNVVAGALVGILALIRWGVHQPGWSWLTLILGMWLVISPFVLFLSAAAMWNNVILGILIAAFALTNTYSKVSAET
jgi:hypothetical protein